MPEGYSSISQPSLKMPTLSFGGGLHLGIPCSNALLARVEREKAKKGLESIIKRPMNILKPVIR